MYPWPGPSNAGLLEETRVSAKSGAVLKSDRVPIRKPTPQEHGHRQSEDEPGRGPLIDTALILYRARPETDRFRSSPTGGQWHAYSLLR